MSSRTNILANIDWIVVFLYLFMITFGWMNIFASGYNDSFKSVFNLNTNYGVQLVWIIISLATILVVFILDHKFYHFFAYAIYGLTIFSLIVVLVFGAEVHGARSWFRIFGFSFQPSELAKIGTALALARYLSGYNITKFKFRTFLICSAFIGAPFLLILVQPDPGTSLVFLTFLFVLFREGLPGWILLLIVFLGGLFLFSLLYPAVNIIIALVIIALAVYYLLSRKLKIPVLGLFIMLLVFFGLNSINRSLNAGYSFANIVIATLLVSTLIFVILILSFKIKYALLVLVFLYGFIAIPYSVDFVFHHFLKSHQQRRVNIMLGKEIDPKGYGYNVNQSKIAIGSGGFSGKGFLEGTQTKLDFVPEQSTDFIFCTVGEEWGFIGTFLVVVLFAGLLIRIVFIAERQRSKFVRIYAYGVASIIFFHFVINISMTIGLFPVIGIPLPFFSYGGSSLLSFTLLLFILVRLDAARMAYLK